MAMERRIKTAITSDGSEVAAGFQEGNRGCLAALLRFNISAMPEDEHKGTKLTNYLLDQQLRRLEQDFLKEGGLRERMTRARLAARARQQGEVCMSEASFNDSDRFRKDDDVRWQFGVPPKDNAHFTWVQHFIHHLAPQGMAGFVLANGSMSVVEEWSAVVSANLQRASRLRQSILQNAFTGEL
jgi:four helix bundle suffix protein